MDLAVTEGIHSTDNYDHCLCSTDEGRGCWTAWAAFGRAGSRVFARRFDGQRLLPTERLSDTDRMQAQPVCLPQGEGTAFVWLEKGDNAYHVFARHHDGAALGPGECLHDLPLGAKPWALTAAVDARGDLWVAWEQSVTGRCTIEVARRGSDAAQFALGTLSRYNYRPQLVSLADAGVYVAWDSYVDVAYRVHGCAIGPDGPGDAEPISRAPNWQNRVCLCRDTDGDLWAVWVWTQDVMWRGSIIQQRFALRGARRRAGEWRPLVGPDGGPDIAPLNYGLLTDFTSPPQLGHMGRRLHPMLVAAADRGVWLLHEAKEDDSVSTLSSRGRLSARRSLDGEWSEPVEVAVGQVHYALPHDETVAEEVFLLARDIDVDELHLGRAALSLQLPRVPARARSVDRSGWQDITLPLPAPTGEPEPNRLPGQSGCYELLWGDFHCHSAMSIEMEGEPDELAHYARDKAGLHALTVSDNDHFWNKFTRNNQRYLKDYEWDHVLGNAKVTDEPGRFAMFPGYEMTIGGNCDAERDHRSIMADDDEMAMDNLHLSDPHYSAHRLGPRSLNKDVAECIAWAKERGYLALVHPHNGMWNLTDLDAEWDVDVCAGWMRNIEHFDCIFDRLDEGHAFGFSGSGDSHYRNPGFNGAVTGLWAEGVTRAAVLDALKQRRCYATAGQRLVVEFTIDDCMMGSSLRVRHDPMLKWRVAGEGQEYILRVHRDGRLMHEESFFGETEGGVREHRFLAYRPGRHYYYLEIASPEPVPDYPSNVAHALGARAWTSPIWVEAAGRAL